MGASGVSTSGSGREDCNSAHCWLGQGEGEACDSLSVHADILVLGTELRCEGASLRIQEHLEGLIDRTGRGGQTETETNNVFIVSEQCGHSGEEEEQS